MLPKLLQKRIGLRDLGKHGNAVTPVAFIPFMISPHSYESTISFLRACRLTTMHFTVVDCSLNPVSYKPVETMAG